MARITRIATLHLGIALVGSLALSSSAAAQASKSVVNLHPDNAGASMGFGVAGTQQAGWIVKNDFEFRAVIWSGSAGSFIDLTPAGSPTAQAYATNGTQQVGYVVDKIQQIQRASLWSGTAGSWIDLNPAGSLDSRALGISGTGNQQVGYADIQVGSSLATVASLWSGTAASWVNLHPNDDDAFISLAFGTNGTQQVGTVEFFEGPWIRASLWSGTAASWVDLNPAGATGSIGLAIAGDQQVGWAIIGGVGRAGLWTGTAASWLDLHPDGATASRAEGTNGTYQVGFATVDGVQRASLWAGTPDSWKDLTLALEGSWGDTIARDVWTDGKIIYTVGSGFNLDTGRTEALLWINVIPAPGPVGLLAIAGLLTTRRRRQ